MATDEEYKRDILALPSHPRLLKFWQQRKTTELGIWEEGKAFEYAILRAFELERATVRYPFPIVGPPDAKGTKPGIIEQVDGVVYADGLAVVLEMKEYDKPIDIEPVAKLRMRLERRPPGTIGVIFALEGLTMPALYLLRNTHPKNILVWQNAEIELALRKKWLRRGLTAKYRHAVEYGLPDYNLITELSQ